MEKLDENAARGWSKDRIRVEIEQRRWDIRELRETIEEDEAYYRSSGYRAAEPGWSMGPYNRIYQLEAEIKFLMSLL